MSQGDLKNIESPNATVFKNSNEFNVAPTKKEKMTTFTRETAEFENKEAKKKYIIANKQFEQQFYNLYMIRLTQMKDRVTRRAVKELGNGIKIAKRVVNLNEEEEALAIGTLYKDMKLKPNILLEYTKERYVDSDIPDLPEDVNTLRHRTSAEDVLILEDETGRTKLVFDDEEQLQKLMSTSVTGIIIACLGQEDHNGNFNVKKYFFNGYPEQSPYPKISADHYVAIVSGLLIGDAHSNIMAAQTMVDYLCGAVGGSQENDYIASKVVRVIIAGNSVAAPDRLSGELFGVRGSLRPREMTSLVEPMKVFDRLVHQLASSLDVDIMPGEQDPSNTALPQQPLHSSMLPLSSKLSTTRLVTNPYALSVNDVSILGSSGQNVDDVRKYSDLDSPLDIMDNMLQWAHLAPTAPDTLNCYPFKERDAFTIDNQPHVFFTGNQDKFACRVVQDKGVKTLLVSVPSFTTDPALVLVNLRTLACHPIYFNINNEWI